MIKQTLTTIAACLLALVPSHAEEKGLQHPVKPLLWKVEGGDLQQPSWLFGTIHLSDKQVTTLHPLAEKAFKDSDIICTEISMDPEEQMAVAMKAMRQDGKKLTDSIGEKTTNELAEELRAINPQLTTKPLESFKTWTVAVTVPALKQQLAGKAALDQVLWTRAKEDGKELTALETADFQIMIFDDLKENEQVTLLSETLKYLREKRQAGLNPFDEILNAYITGEPEKVKAVINAQTTAMTKGEHKELGLKIQKLVLDDRNTSMTKTMVERFKAKPDKIHFVAVGAGHMIGENSICDQLRDKGYTVTLHQD